MQSPARKQARLDRYWREAREQAEIQIGNLRFLIARNERERRAAQVGNPTPRKKF